MTDEEGTVKLALKNCPDEQQTLSTWSNLPDIELVTDSLSMQDRSFLNGIGSLLADAQQTSRFGVTLLHSHFEVRSDECLVEASEKDGSIVTSVKLLTEVDTDNDVVASSWMFSQNPPENYIEALDVLTWRKRADEHQIPLNERDAVLIHTLAEQFRAYRVTKLFGMCLVGKPADTGRIWTEGTNFEERRLVQEQLPLIEVEAREPVKTVWAFDQDGKYLITMGCCYQLSSKRGHSGDKHRVISA